MRQSSSKLHSTKNKRKPGLPISLVFKVLFFIFLLGVSANLSYFLSQSSASRAGATASSGQPRTTKQHDLPEKNVKSKDSAVVDEKVTPDGEQIGENDDAQVEEEHYPDDDPNEKTQTHLSLEEGRDHIKEIFLDAGVELDNATLYSLPTWNTIVDNIGEGPAIFGLDRCENFRSTIKAVDRMVGCCGMFNSGTNLVTRLVKENCKIPERVEHYGWNGTFERWGIGPFEAHGMRWQVPWGKHTAANYRDQHTTNKAGDISKECTLPVVTIRNPYDWMKSMCKNRYTAKWPHGNKCPHLVSNPQTMQGTNLSVKYGDYEDWFDSLAHLWNGWYHQYWKEADYPFLMVRFEDLIFHAKNVTTQICHCAGGEIRTDRPFFHIVKSAKDGPGHGKKEERTDMVKAWKRFGNPMPARADFSKVDYKAARKFLDKELMKVFGYKHPKPV